MRLWVWISAMVEGIWLALRHWRRRPKRLLASRQGRGGSAQMRVNHMATALVNKHKPFLWRTGNWGNKMVVGTKRVGGAIVKRNRYTVWFQLYDGRIIKRHIRKHCVVETAW